MNLYRKLNGGPERGESSAAGAARHRLLLSSSQVELITTSARKRFVIDLIKKATGEETRASPASSIRELEV
jgi:tRNA U34 5-methylaminomethyl-2-thiouridine-forming methyltransferase MnmC